MTSGFIYLFAGYVASEAFRSAERHRLGRDVVHAVCTAIVGYVLAVQWTVWLPALLTGLCHLVASRLLTKAEGSARRWILRHSVLLVAMLLLAEWFDLGARTQLHTFYESFDEIIIVITAVLFTVNLGSEFMTCAIRPFSETSNDSTPTGFPSGGKVIGQYERLLILIFVLANSPTAIGFLVASKSIFRFGDLKDASSRKSAEYILIGTLISFSFGLLVAYSAKYLLSFVP